MPATINVQAQNVWKLFESEKAALRTKLKLIAENPDYGVEIYLTNNDERPNIVVCMDDVECCTGVACDSATCEQLASDYYDAYLTSNVLSHLNDMDDPEDWQEKDIEDRENELDILVYDFISAVLDTDLADYASDKATAIMDDCKEHFLEYMARKWELPICRPMILEDENGEEFFEEYPYECMEFDDPDNPIYE